MSLPQLNTEYGVMTGFIGVSVTGFREGSIFTAFVVETTEVNATELAEANREFSKAVTSTIAPVIGSVTALYISKSNIASEKELRIDGTIYKGDRMRLVCEPSINVGQISSVEWTFSGREKITESKTRSVLTIEKADDVLDIGPYQCTLMGDVLQFRQERKVIGDDIKSPPNINISKSYINVQCVEGQTVPLKCCVQSPFKVKWSRGSLALDAGVTENGTSFCRTYEYTLEACGTPTSLTFTCKVVDFDYSRLLHVKTVCMGMDDKTNYLVQNVLQDSRDSWTALNANESQNASSNLLGSMELLSDKINGTFTFKTAAILFDRSTFDNSFSANLNSSVVLDIPDTGFSNTSITTITFFTLNNVMPVRSSSSNPNNTDPVNALNAAVVLIKVNETIRNCVFWNFKLFNNRGAWDSDGCEFVSDINDTVTCRCDHLTSFSILMSTGYVWKAITKNSTAFMRHVSIINTALSLLIADICFIIGAAIADNPAENPEKNNFNVPVDSCSTATFFMHFFYLAVFFWMLVSGLLLFYRTVMVFSHMSKSVMLAIGFLLGYGCPLIIAVVTVAVTAPGEGYITNKEACWLNWEQTRALLAFVIPALSIVCINIIIVIVVLFKMLRRGVGDAAKERKGIRWWSF
ncbi:hypothetical protein F7725_003946 [Dissostichus mawsoni]|uniref:Adhesion G protein-coupled receptor F5 n=1 Tax=Dissostichus mawsoni TaxID=36200 RepID=A0A7J5YEZ2_DISMA|nr:hypothetical protein F7725_003946 [Dissostichus mawsoni]